MCLYPGSWGIHYGILGKVLFVFVFKMHLDKRYKSMDSLDKSTGGFGLCLSAHLLCNFERVSASKPVSCFVNGYVFQGLHSRTEGRDLPCCLLFGWGF